MKKAMPRIMVAPNGAHTKRKDHPNLPLTLEEVGNEIAACVQEGVEAYHLHVHEDDGGHSLDIGKFRALFAYLEERFPECSFQATTESVGLYDHAAQYQVVESLKPWSAALVLRDMLTRGSPEGEERFRDFLSWCHEEEILIQHLLRHPDEVNWVMDLVERAVIPRTGICLQLLSGKTTMEGGGSMLEFESFMTALNEAEDSAKARWGAEGEGLLSDWMMGVCGKEETAILQAALSRGGKIRLGFENNIWNRDGDIAQSNAERLREILKK